MSQGYISAAISDETLDLLLAKLEEFDTLLTFLISLSTEDRKRLYKARAGAIPIAHQIASRFPEIFPSSFPKAEMDKDVLLTAPLQTLRSELLARTSAIDDTLMALQAGNMKHVREVYKYAKAAQDDVPGIKPLVEQLAVYFDRSNRPTPETVEEPPAN